MKEEAIKALKQFDREDLIDSPYGYDIDDNIEIFMTIRQMIKYNNLQSQLKAKEEVIKEAREYNQKIVDDYLKEDDCEYCDGRYATATHNLEILSKGENK